MEYITAKNKLNAILIPFYTQSVFRKYRWFTHINKTRSEANMINRFKETFGSPKDVVIAYGDFCEKRQMKFKEPSLGIGMRRLFRKHGFKDLYLADEFRTSKKCYYCKNAGKEQGENDKFLKVKNLKPCKCDACKPYKYNYTGKMKDCVKDKEVLRHGLLKCQTCDRVWNRDVNSSLNIQLIGRCALAKKSRPAYLSRTKEEEEEEKKEDEEAEAEAQNEVGKQQQQQIFTQQSNKTNKKRTCVNVQQFFFKIQ